MIFQWLFKKPFKCIIVQMMLLEQPGNKLKMPNKLRLISCLFHLCRASLECLHRLFERPLESSHAFGQHFKQPVNTSLCSQVTLRDANDIIVCLFKERLLSLELGQFSATVIWCWHDGCLLCLACIYILFLPLWCTYIRKYKSIQSNLGFWNSTKFCRAFLCANDLFFEFLYLYVCMYMRKVKLKYLISKKEFNYFLCILLLVMCTYRRTYCHWHSITRSFFAKF